MDNKADTPGTLPIRPDYAGRPEWVAKLGENELKAWTVYQDFLYCMDTTVVEPSIAASVAAALASVVVSGMGLANINPPGGGGGKP